MCFEIKVNTDLNKAKIGSMGKPTTLTLNSMIDFSAKLSWFMFN